MAVYDLEEQDQLEDLKAWWRRWGTLITAIVVAASLTVVGVQGWRWWKYHQAAQASTLYSAAILGVKANDLARTRDAVTQLTDRYGGTTYAASGAMLLARMLFDKGDKAGAIRELQWVVDHGGEEARQIARYRLAEAQFDARQYDDALRTLDAKHDEPFTALYADLRGDILAAAGRTAEARAAYQVAVAKLDQKLPYRAYVQVKLDALGGPTAPLAATASEIALPAAQPPSSPAPASGSASTAAAARPDDPAPVPRAGIAMRIRRRNVVVALLASTLVAGCGTINSLLPSFSLPSFLGGGGRSKPGPLPDIRPSTAARVLWQAPVGKASPGLAPTMAGDAVYAAASDGTIVRLDAPSGRQVWRINAGKGLSAGVGADANLLVVGTAKGEVLAFGVDGKPLWQTRVSSEVLAPPVVAEGTVGVWSGDGRIYGLAAADGKTKWVHQRVNPPLTVRNSTGGVFSRGGLFSGTAGGKLLALDFATGTVGWESSVATPKGATELERIADVTSLPVVRERQVCAVAYQGRIACFELTRGTIEWSRDISSLTGIAADARYYYVTDDRGSIHALDHATGASVWTQDKLAQRRPGGPQIVGDYLGVVDAEGYLHLLGRDEGALVGRLATDGTPATAQPTRAGTNALWQSEGGTLYMVTAP